MSKPKNPYEKEYCNWCDRPFKSCYDSLCDDLQGYIKEGAWDEGYTACANQPISEQEGWETGKPTDEGTYLIVTKDNCLQIANYISDEDVFLGWDDEVYSIDEVSKWKLYAY